MPATTLDLWTNFWTKPGPANRPNAPGGSPKVAPYGKTRQRPGLWQDLGRRYGKTEVAP